MHIKHLHLKAVGPFTDRILHFDSPDPGLHIIYGPNEAGKSSSLRALKALLYGFHQQTPDNFLHNYDQLLVGGCLVNSDGEELHFLRRKKRIGDIIDEAGNPLPADTLSHFLHGVNPEIFASLYGIDHETLVQGGEEILAQKGEVGQALFAAGAGISSLRQLTDTLDQEAAELFKLTGQLPKINQAIKRYKDLQKEAKAVTLSCKDWKELHKALQTAGKQRAALEQERDQKNSQVQHLQRLAQAIPELASLQAYRNQLAALGNVTLLPPDFREHHRQVAQAIREAELQLQKDSERLVKLQEKRAALSFNQSLLAQAEKIDDLHQRLGEYRKGLQDKPEREGMRISLRREAANLLHQVRPDLSLLQLEPLRAVLVKKKSVQLLSEDYAAINRQLLLAKKQNRIAEQEQHQAREALAALPHPNLLQDSQKLRRLVKMAQREGNIDALVERTRNEIDQSKKDCLAELKRLGHWTGELSTLVELPLPLVETLQQADKRYSDVREQRQSLEKEQNTIEQELRKTSAEIKKNSSAGEIPSEQSLVKARAKREQGWQILHRQWLLHQDVTQELLAYAPHQPLAEVYTAYVREADSIADRLRREADRVAGAAALRVQEEILQIRLDELAENRTILERRQQELDKSWRAVWHRAGIDPLSPKEMSAWLAAIDKLRYKVGDILKKEREIDSTTQRRKTLRRGLHEELDALGEQTPPAGQSVGPIVAFAETFLETAAKYQLDSQRLTERHAAAKKNSKQTQAEFRLAEESLAAWQQQWHATISAIGLPGGTATAEASELIDIVQSCFAKVKEADDLQKRIDGIDRDALHLQDDVHALLQQVAPDLLAVPLDQAILHLRTLLNQSQKASTLYDKLSEEIDGLEMELAGIRRTLLSATTQMAEILRLAGSEKEEELPKIMGTFDQYQKLNDKISDTEASLAKISAGNSLSEITQQAQEMDADELPGRIDTLRRDIGARIHPEINKISQVIGELTNKLAAMDGSARAAELNQEMEQELARIRRLAERYTLVKLAAKILQLEIERYREEHQDPVLLIASRYFHDMTLGSFTGLRTDIDDKGGPVLVGIRPDDRRIPVDGMSSGTRDQLYLSLRLATLEYRLEAHEPMPFIVDDILINFDDQRARATLNALAGLAGRNQVILFTHHQQILNETKNISRQNSVIVHTL